MTVTIIIHSPDPKLDGRSATYWHPYGWYDPGDLVLVRGKLPKRWDVYECVLQHMADDDFAGDSLGFGELVWVWKITMP